MKKRHNVQEILRIVGEVEKTVKMCSKSAEKTTSVREAITAGAENMKEWN